MKSFVYPAIFALLIAFFCPANLKNCVEDVKKYAVCYSKVYPDEAKNFQLLITDPDLYSGDEVEKFKKAGIKIVAYLNIAELEDFRYSVDSLDDIIIGVNPIWPGHYFVDLNSKKWQSLIFEKRIPIINLKGFDGFFLDMLDIVNIYPRYEETVVNMVKRIRKENRQKIIIVNNGLKILKKIKNYIDAVLVEGLFTEYDFERKSYRVKSPGEYLENVKLLQSSGVKIFTLDFLPPGDSRRQELMRIARAFGFVPYVSTVNLDTLYGGSR